MPQTLRAALYAFLSAWAGMLLAGSSVRNPLILPMFAGLFLFYRKITESKEDGDAFHKRPWQIAAAVYTLLFLFAEHNRLTEEFTSRLFRTLTLLIFTAGMFLFLFHFLPVFAAAVCERDCPEKEGGGKVAAVFFARPFLITFCLCLLCWTPYFLYEYPGICSPDSIVQLEQAAGLRPYSNHHPIIHTYLLSLFYRFGVSVGNVNAGVALYTAAQMMFLASACAFTVQTLCRFSEKTPRILAPLSTLFYALLPVHGVFATAVWKDIPFAGILLYFTAFLVRILYGEKDVKLPPLLFCSAVLMCIFRSNGWYLYLMLLPFLLWYFLRKKTRDVLVAAVLLSALITAALFRGPVLDAREVMRPDTVESLSVPLQQVARVIVNNKPLKEDERELLQQVIAMEHVKSVYAEDFADNMKELVRAGNQAYLTGHLGDFARLWFRLGLRYPGTYLEAWIALTKGFWYPDVAYHTAFIDGVVENSLGVYHSPVLRGPVFIKLKEIGLKAGEFVPVLGLFYSMGTYTWILLFALIRALSEKNGKKTLLLLPSVLLLVTLFLATPVATEFRYAYPVVLSLPYFFFRFRNEDAAKTADKKEHSS